MEAEHLLIANQRSDLLTEQSAQKKEEVLTATGHNTQLLAELANLTTQSSGSIRRIEFLCPSQKQCRRWISLTLEKIIDWGVRC